MTQRGEQAISDCRCGLGIGQESAWLLQNCKAVPSESDTRAKLIDPAIHKCGWTEEFIRREETAGTVEMINGKALQPTRSNKRELWQD